MITRYTQEKIIWIDLETPTNDEVRAVMEEFNLHPLVAEELLGPTLRPRVDLHKNYIYLILHFPAARHSHRETRQEIDFVIGRDFIITTRYDTIDPLYTFAKIFERQAILHQTDAREHAGYIFFAMSRLLYAGVMNELAFISNRLTEIEENIFAGKEREMVSEISNISRELLAFKRSLALHPETLTSFEACGKEFFGKSFAPYLKAIVGEYHRAATEIEGHIDDATELRETNNSLLSTKQNEIMKTFTILAFAMLPLSLIASVFGMNVEQMPLVSEPNGFWLVLALMAVIPLPFFLYFRYKKWF